MQFYIVATLVGLVSAIPAPAPQAYGADCTELYVDETTFAVPQSVFQKRKRGGGYCDWTDDGCSFSPDQPFGYNFYPSCQRHDFGYRNFKAQRRFDSNNKLLIDKNLLKELQEECFADGQEDLCYSTAGVYYNAVRMFGNVSTSEGREFFEASMASLDASSERVAATREFAV